MNSLHAAVVLALLFGIVQGACVDIRGVYETGGAWLTYPTRDGSGQVTSQWASLYTDDMTWDVWVRVPSQSVEFQTSVMWTYGANHNTNAYSSSSRRRNIGVLISNSGTLAVLSFTGLHYYEEYGTNIMDDQWHHVAVVWKRSTTTGVLYIDGVASATSTYNPGNDNPGMDGQLTLGGGHYGRRIYCSLANFRMWGKALAASEVLLYKDSADPSIDGTVAF
ncbi:unnamed protein product [Prorocentrum cordatum]|uniref:LamG-like jellyroll fold domain-containing protein n=1 Tax=Prorocentrum cordatum TaxID=2364126 RepID=A0ABN9XUY2_9DINO|nr:unnamed protein product [Polarella glacialis]